MLIDFFLQNNSNFFLVRFLLNFNNMNTRSWKIGDFKYGVSNAIFSADDTLIACYAFGKDGMKCDLVVKVVSSGKTVLRCKGEFDESGTTIAFSPIKDSCLLAVATMRNEVLLFDCKIAKPRPRILFYEHYPGRDSTNITFSGKGSFLILNNQACSDIKIWDVRGDEPRFLCSVEGGILVRLVVASPDESLLLCFDVSRGCTLITIDKTASIPAFRLKWSGVTNSYIATCNFMGGSSNTCLCVSDMSCIIILDIQTPGFKVVERRPSFHPEPKIHGLISRLCKYFTVTNFVNFKASACLVWECGRGLQSFSRRPMYVLFNHISQYRFSCESFSQSERFLCIFGSLDKKMQISFLGEYSDRTHRHFSQEFRRLIFILMCIKARLENKATKTRGIPRLPMCLWLDIFSFLEQSFSKSPCDVSFAIR